MNLLHRRKLSEAVDDWIDSTDYATMTDEEEWWHKKITAILLNKKGKWGPYQHALYALRFQDFILKIVPTTVDPYFTACVVFDRAVIYIGEGFLVDDSKCYQLNVIIRHEMAHILLRHQIRMMHKIGELPHSRISTSMSLNSLLNIIADFEISNKKYTSEDKGIVLNMYLNGKLIGGLVTEMHRKEWAALPIEQMYDKLVEELNQISADLSEVEGVISDLRYGSDTRRKLARDDYITGQGLEVLAKYTNKKAPSFIWAPIEEYFKTSKQFKSCAKSVQEFLLKIYDLVKHFAESELAELLDNIVSSGAVDFVPIAGSDYEIATPEEKFFATQVIKTLLGNAREKPAVTIKKATHSKAYVDAYNTIIRKCGGLADCSDEELAEIMGSAPTPEDEEKMS